MNDLFESHKKLTNAVIAIAVIFWGAAAVGCIALAAFIVSIIVRCFG